jgi:hypothetical protein
MSLPLLQRLLKHGPRWAGEAFFLAILLGCALTGLANLFRPAIEHSFGSAIDVTQLNFENLILISLIPCGLIVVAVHALNPFSRRDRKMEAAVNQYVKLSGQLKVPKSVLMIEQHRFLTALTDTFAVKLLRETRLNPQAFIEEAVERMRRETET